MDARITIHPGTLILAAIAGDENCMRYLHGRGVPLWGHAWDDVEAARFSILHSRREISAHACTWFEVHSLAARDVIVLPSNPEHASHMRGALWYAWVHGAPLTPAMTQVFKAKRVATRAVLGCFHLAAVATQGSAAEGAELREGTGERGTGATQGGIAKGAEPRDPREGTWKQGNALSQGSGAKGPHPREGTVEQKAAWAVMGRVPLDLIERILTLAEFEIPETFRRGLPKATVDESAKREWLSKHAKSFKTNAHCFPNPGYSPYMGR
jgi:hypothetical protein